MVQFASYVRRVLFILATVLFLGIIMQKEVIHVNLFAVFCHICRTTVC